jgi:hypothetical protein
MPLRPGAGLRSGSSRFSSCPYLAVATRELFSAVPHLAAPLPSQKRLTLDGVFNHRNRIYGKSDIHTYLLKTGHGPLRMRHALFQFATSAERGVI